MLWEYASRVLPKDYAMGGYVSKCDNCSLSFPRYGKCLVIHFIFITNFSVHRLDDASFEIRRNMYSRWFQQSRVSPHSAKDVRRFWIAHFRGNELNVQDRLNGLQDLQIWIFKFFYFWGHFKLVVYTDKPKTLQALKDNITQEIWRGFKSEFFIGLVI